MGRTVFVVTLAVVSFLSLGASGADAAFAVKYFIDGHVIAPTWGAPPQGVGQCSGWIADMDGDTSSPEMIAYGNPNGGYGYEYAWTQVGITHVGTGFTQWFDNGEAGYHPSEAGDKVASPVLLDVDGDGLMDALVPVMVPIAGMWYPKTVVIGWSGVAAASDPGVTVASSAHPSVVSPNPSPGSCRVSFSTATDGPVSVQVFDVSGRLLRRLLDGPHLAGDYSVIWDGKDDAGREVASGFYMARITTREGSTTASVVVAK